MRRLTNILNQFRSIDKRESFSVSYKNMQFYHCSCYYTNNIYVKSVNRHFTYYSEDQFFRDYDKILNGAGCSISDKEAVIREIEEEISRRKSLSERTANRKELIKSNYVPLDSSVFYLKEDFLEPSFIELVEISKSLNYSNVMKMVEKISAEKELYRFPVFKKAFCQKLLQELQNIEQSNLPREKPNSMNNYGVLLDEFGFHDNFTLPLRVKYLDPLSRALFPKWRGEGLDSHKVFTVGYKLGQDTELGYHFDNSEVTLNVCLGKNFQGGKLYFGDMRTTPMDHSTCILVSHEVGYGILHRGHQFHGALPIQSGERHNLILWMRSSSVRNLLCPMCDQKPALIPSIDYGDGFTNPDETLSCNLL